MRIALLKAPVQPAAAATDVAPIVGERDIAPGVLEHTQGRARRVALLKAHAAILASQEDTFVIDVAVSDEYGLPSRLLLDVPRRRLRYLGLPVAEPGERLDDAGERIMHYFFDEDLASELAEAGLVIEQREGSRFRVRRGRPPSRATLASVRSVQIARIAWALPQVERVLRRASPNALFRFARSLGRRAPSTPDRASHRRAVAWVDAFSPGARGCYRRTALELATSREAAAEDVLLGLDMGRTGHAWLASDPRARAYDVRFRLSPDEREEGGGS